MSFHSKPLASVLRELFTPTCQVYLCFCVGDADMPITQGEKLSKLERNVGGRAWLPHRKWLVFSARTHTHTCTYTHTNESGNLSFHSSRREQLLPGAQTLETASIKQHALKNHINLVYHKRFAQGVSTLNSHFNDKVLPLREWANYMHVWFKWLLLSWWQKTLKSVWDSMGIFRNVSTKPSQKSRPNYYGSVWLSSPRPLILEAIKRNRIFSLLSFQFWRKEQGLCMEFILYSPIFIFGDIHVSELWNTVEKSKSLNTRHLGDGSLFCFFVSSFLLLLLLLCFS